MLPSPSPARGSASTLSPPPTAGAVASSASHDTATASVAGIRNRITAAQFTLAPHSVTTTVVTTTTTTTTQYPPLHIPAAPPANPHEYPLADTPTPPALKKFCFDLNGVPTHFRELDLLPEDFAKRKSSRSGHRVSVTTSTQQHSAPSTYQQVHHRQHPVSSPSRRNIRKRTAPTESEDIMTAPVEAEVCAASPVPPPLGSVVDAKAKIHKRRVSGNARVPSPPPQMSGPSRYEMGVPSTTPPHISSNAHRTKSPNLPSPTLSPTSNPTHLPFPQSQPNSAPATPQGQRALSPDPSSDVNGLHRSLQSSLLSPALQQQLELPPEMANSPSLSDVPYIISTFDALPPQLKSYLLLHLLRRCPFSTLQFISSLILPTLKRDFIGLLPVELSYQILQYLDLRSLGRCTVVSKAWKRVVDGEGAEFAVWKKRLVEEQWFDEEEIRKEIESAWAVKESHKATQELGLDPLRVGSGSSHAAAPPSPPLGYAGGDGANVNGEDEESGSRSRSRGRMSKRNLVGVDSSSTLNNDAQLASGHRSHEAPPHLHKHLFRRHHMIRQNWMRGRYKHVSFPGHTFNVVTCLQFDAEKIVSGSDDQTIHIYDTLNGALLKRLEGHEGGVWALQYLNYTLVSGSTDRTVRVWDIDTGRCTHLFEGHTSTVRCLMIVNPKKSDEYPGRMEPSMPLIVTGSRDATLRVWRLPDPKRDQPYLPPGGGSSPPSPDAANNNPFFMHVLNGHTSSVRAIAGSGNVLVSGSYDTTVRVWDLTSGDAVHVFRGHREKVYSVGYCHELRRAVSGSMDSTVRVWCTRTGQALFNLEGHTSLVGLLELSPQYLVSAAADATLRIWSPTTGQCLATLTGHAAAITCFHHDGKLNRIVSGSDGGVKVWELSSAGYGSNSHHPSATGPAFTQGPYGREPVYGRFIRDLVGQVQGVWRVRMDERRLVCAVQREGNRTWFEVLDFGEGVEDGVRIEGVGDGGGVDQGESHVVGARGGSEDLEGEEDEDEEEDEHDEQEEEDEHDDGVGSGETSNEDEVE